jgi:hypothetical protein
LFIKYLFIRFPSILAIAFYLPQVVAQDIVTLPPVIVNAPPESLNQTARNIELLQKEDLTRMHQRRISDVLQGAASYSFSRLGGIAQTGATFLSGAGGQGIMTLDDIPILQSIPGSNLTDNSPSEAINPKRRDTAWPIDVLLSLSGSGRRYPIVYS